MITSSAAGITMVASFVDVENIYFCEV